MMLPYLLLVLFVSSESASTDPGYNGVEDGDTVTDVVIQTKVGGIQGFVVNSSGIVTTRFLGIPYARPPIGELRFALPQRHPGWAVSAPLQATEYRFACHQDMEQLKAETHDDVYRRRLDKVLISEDCLYLNIYVAVNMSKELHLNTRSMSVMVFLHGGGFQRGTSIPYEGWRLAGHQGVIVVSVEYRVGAFGFLSTQNSAAPGNLGLWDQRQALHWIWDNVREFGGSPESITVFGEDAGAMSAGYHVLSPQSRGLLSRVIMQSGSVISPSAIQKTPITIATSLAGKLGCSIANSTKMVECLQRISANELQSASVGTSWLPIVDGKFLPDTPRVLLQQGNFNWVDAIIGVRKDTLVKSPPLAFSQFESQLKAGTQNIFLVHQEGGRFEEFYAAVLLEYAFCEDSLTLLSDFKHDALTVAPSVETARHLSRADKNIFFYSFDVDQEELPFVFGEKTEAGDVVFQRALMDAWSNFAQTGDPNPVNDRGIHWRPFDEIQRHYVALSRVLDKRSMHQYPWQRACAFWNEYVPHVLSAKNRRWGAQCSGQELCSSLVGTVRSPDHITAAAMWTLTGTCFILLLVLVAISALCCLRYDCCRRASIPADDISRTPIYQTPTKQQQNSLRRKHLKQNTPNGSESRRLHPLPYCDETT